MEQTPKYEKAINDMGLNELQIELERAKDRLEGLLREVEQYPTEDLRDEAKEKAAAQFDALIAMAERSGHLKREAVAEMKAGTSEREIPPADHLARDIKPII